MSIVLLSLGLSSCGETVENPTPQATVAPQATETTRVEETISTEQPPIEESVNVADIEEGRAVFQIYCQSCHMIDSDRIVVGPPLMHIGSLAATRQAGVSAEEYLRESILDPNKFIVEGFMAGLMQQNFTDTLDEEQINQLVAYMLTLE